MLALGVLGSLLGIAIVGVSLLLIGLVLLQKNRGSGLSGAFGGVGGHSAFGTKTGDFLTWVTVSLAAVFLLLNVAGVHTFRIKPTAPQTTPLFQSPIELEPDVSTEAPPADAGRTPGGAPPAAPQTPAPAPAGQ